MELIILDILTYIRESNSPDLHLKTNSNPYLRNTSWELEIVEEIKLKSWKETKIWKLSSEDIKKIIIKLVWEDGFKKFEDNLELDSSFSLDSDSKFRINCYKDSDWYAVALRLIPWNVPEMDAIWLGWNIKNMLSMSKWLILVTGPTGSWKSTNLASMINYINSNFKKHIITIEDPIEFSFKNKQSLINQREIWNDTLGFEKAIKSSLREDPDVIVIWEMRDLETIKAALTLAETGHLVISTLHTNDTVQSIDRIIDVFPSNQQSQIRMQLAMSLIWIISQRLVKKSNSEWRIPAREILINNDAIKNLILIWKTYQIYSVLEVSDNKWMILMDKYLVYLYKKWFIDKDSIKAFARDIDIINTLMQ